MKKCKLLTLVLALTVLLAAALPLAASAADPLGTDGTITIKPPTSHSIAADDFNAYKLFTVTAITGTTSNPQFVYEPVTGITSFLAVDGMAAKYGATADAFRQWLQASSEDSASLIELAKDLTANKALMTAADAAEKVGSNVVFDDLDYGYYLVTGSALRTDPNGDHSANVISRAMLANVPEIVKTGEEITGTTKDVKIDLKADAPTINKEVWNHNLGTVAKDEAGWTDWTDVSIGDTVYFQHTSTVPDMKGYSSYSFIVHDIMSAGLDFNKDSVIVTIGEDVYSTDYYMVRTDEGVAPDTFKITFSPSAFVNLTAGSTIKITYEAKLNASAKINTDTPNHNSNKVQLEYSNNPNGAGTGKTPWDEVKVYTFDFNIYKYTGASTPGTPLPGAKFKLNDGTSDLTFVEISDGNYRKAVTGDATTTTELESPANGTINIKGLDAGTYTLTETAAPSGYNMISGPITVEIIHDGAGTKTLEVGGEAATQVNVQNSTGGMFPGTGGAGVVMIYAAGIAGAVALAGYIFFLVRRRRKNLLNG